MKEILINIQVSEAGKEWSEITAYKTIKIEDEMFRQPVLQSICNFLDRPIRVTTPFNNVPIDRLNGGYIYPQN